MTLISLDNVSLKRGGKTLLKNINFTVEKGEIFSIFGPSGAGKSSLLRLLNRLYEPETGKIFFNGKDI
ncbi:MAG TPA: ATP-binding cassette domain-containing protein, partial [candidate division WOR-3 bacterium]|nr:ATP-binding cassette domain-containing protein [candidate division WOR-3 bacterium]